MLLANAALSALLNLLVMGVFGSLLTSPTKSGATNERSGRSHAGQGFNSAPAGMSPTVWGSGLPLSPFWPFGRRRWPRSSETGRHNNRLLAWGSGGRL